MWKMLMKDRRILWTHSWQALSHESKVSDHQSNMSIDRGADAKAV